MDMASNQPDNLALTAEQLREYSAAFNADRANLVAANAAVFGITENQLINNFHLIQQDWKTGET